MTSLSVKEPYDCPHAAAFALLPLEVLSASNTETIEDDEKDIEWN